MTVNSISGRFLFPFIIIAVVSAYWVYAHFQLSASIAPNPYQRIEAASLWPKRANDNALSPEQTERLRSVLSAMTLEQKVGQLIIADVSSVKPKDLSEYPLGALLAGGNSAPAGQRFADASSWLAFADQAFLAAQNYDAEIFVPPLFGIDAVHGHNNVFGAVIFPHNIGLGAANDPDLTRQIGVATARALAATGHDWNFAPTVAVAQDVRWGRTYESFSQDPLLVKFLATAFVEGIQEERLGNGMVLATAKHFIGDGGTVKGKDQGDTRLSEAELSTIHGPGFEGALDANVATVMASYSSWNGSKLHGDHYLLTTILKERFAFEGFVVGDWDAHAQIKGCSSSNCAKSINAGVDMLMAPTEWKGLYHSLLAAAKAGDISSMRLDDAVHRILRVKLQSGLLDAKKPSERLGAGNEEAIDSPALRALARKAVRASQVLLKNDNQTLPIRNVEKIAVIGAGADDFPAQCGGWCLSWQGDGLSKSDFAQGNTILDGIKAHAKQRKIDISYASSFQENIEADLAIIVLHSKPYAEYYGDRDSLALPDYNKEATSAIRRYKKRGVPVVTVLVSGRPLWTEKQLAGSSAFVASWLPGTEGGGVADLLFGQSPDGTSQNFTGRLSFPWLKNHQFKVSEKNPALFNIGYGLRYDPQRLPDGKRETSQNQQALEAI